MLSITQQAFFRLYTRVITYKVSMRISLVLFIFPSVKAFTSLTHISLQLTTKTTLSPTGTILGGPLPFVPAASTVLTTPPTLSAAADAQEDLELTRRIILEHIANTNTKKPNGNDDDVMDYWEIRPTNDLMIRAARGEQVEQTPVWLFRQAGRHLPEYQEYKQRTGRNFLQLLASPECVAECTMQPIRRYDLDAAILFSDILVVPEALGIQVTMPGGVGIQVPYPLQTPDEIQTRLPSRATLTPAFVQEKLGHVFKAVRQIRTQMMQESKSIPLIGFSAAPWTLMYYMVGGSSKQNTEMGVHWLQKYPTKSQELLDLLTIMVIEYMDAQVQAGAHMLQVFEAMGMMIDDSNFKHFALPCLAQIAQELKRRHPQTPLMLFARGACHLNSSLKDLGYNVITIDGSVDRHTAREVVGDKITLQGNYDPAELIEENGKTVESVRHTARQLLEELGPQRLIANLGEGLGGKESPVLVDAFIKAIHSESSTIIAMETDKDKKADF